MRAPKQFRYERLRQLVHDQYEDMPAKLAVQMEPNEEKRLSVQNLLYRYLHEDPKKRKAIGDEMAERIERAAGKPPGWLSLPILPDSLNNVLREPGRGDAYQLIADWEALPPGMQKYVSKKVSLLRMYAGALGQFRAANITPPDNEERYFDWEAQFLNDVAATLRGQR